MQRLGDSTGLLRASLHSPALEALSAPERCVLCFHQSAVKWGQLRIRSGEVAPDDAELYVVLLRTGSPATALSSDVLRIYQLTRAEWLALRQVDTHYRLAQVSALREAPESPALCQAVVECMIVEDEPAPPAQQQQQPSLFALPPLWPCEAHVPASQPHRLLFYAATLCDFVALRRTLGSLATPRLHKKWLQWLERHFAPERDECAVLAYQLAATLARAAADWPLASEWLALNCELFAQHAPPPELVAEKLRHHVRWIEAWAHTGFYHRWQEYRVPASDDFWQQHSTHVTINSLWLLQCDGLLHTPGARGSISISHKQLQQHLLPCVYRLMLRDLLQLLRVEAQFTQSWTARQLWDRDCAWYWQSAHTLQPLVAYKAGEWETLVRFSREQAQHSSPVMRALLVQERLEEERRAALRTGQGSAQRVCEAVPDIEELSKHAPPCMQRVLRQPWCKNDDRFNLVGWLYDAGYGPGQVVGYLCRHGAEEGQRETVKSLYQSCVNRPTHKRHKAGRVSTTCGRVIDGEYGAGNVLRCPYEEARNGERRRKHNALEKSAYGAECGQACGLSEVRHPLDFLEKRCGVVRK